jgi:hypothetical protein
MERFALKILYLLTCSILFSCTTENSEDIALNGYRKLQEGYVTGASAKIEIWGRKNFFVGNNNLIVLLYDSLNLKEQITDAHITFMPVMTTGLGSSAVQYGGPVENPDELAINGIFNGAITFIRATGQDSSWKIGIAVHNHQADKEGETHFDVQVGNPAFPVLKLFKSQSADSSNLLLSIDEPANPKTGINDIGFTLNRMVNRMTFVADNSYSFEITAEMPEMGTVSQGNVNPVNIGNGHYKGKVNFTMKGLWKVKVLLKKDGKAVSGNIYFNILL